MATPKQSNSCSSVKVVNDLAERGVALIQEFNSLLTRSEVQKELSTYLLHVIEQHRNDFTAPTKSRLIDRLKQAD